MHTTHDINIVSNSILTQQQQQQRRQCILRIRYCCWFWRQRLWLSHQGVHVHRKTITRNSQLRRVKEALYVTMRSEVIHHAIQHVSHAIRTAVAWDMYQLSSSMVWDQLRVCAVVLPGVHALARRPFSLLSSWRQSIANCN